jgi:hypothetical protein
MSREDQYNHRYSAKQMAEIQGRRVRRLYNGFKKFDVDISGNPNYPMIVIDKCKMLNTYVNNFDLHLLNMPSTNKDRQTVHHLKIDHLDITKKFLDDYLKEYGFTRVYTIRHAGTDLYVAGFNFKIREGNEKLEGRYPVFGRHKLRYFFQKEFAEEIAESYPDYKLVVD